jgi:hypothetical protein
MYFFQIVSNNLTAEQFLQKLTSLSQPMKTELRRGFDSLVQKGLITVNLLGTNFGEKPMSIIGINLGFNPSSIVGFNLLGGLPLDPFGGGGGSSVNLFQIFLQIINMVNILGCSISISQIFFVGGLQKSVFDKIFCRIRQEYTLKMAQTDHFPESGLNIFMPHQCAQSIPHLEKP